MRRHARSSSSSTATPAMTLCAPGGSRAPRHRALEVNRGRLALARDTGLGQGGAPAGLGRGVVGQSLDAEVNREKLDEIGRLIEAGSLRPPTEARLPLEQGGGA